MRIVEVHAACTLSLYAEFIKAVVRHPFADQRAVGAVKHDGVVGVGKAQVFDNLAYCLATLHDTRVLYMDIVGMNFDVKHGCVN